MHRWLEHVLRHENFLRNIIAEKMMGKVPKRMELLDDIMEGKNLISKWSQDSKRESMSET